MDKVVAQGYLGVLVSEEMRQKRLRPEDLAVKAGISPKSVTDVKSGNADLCREEVLRKLICVLFLSGTKRRVKAFRLVTHFRSQFPRRHTNVRKFHLHRRVGGCRR